MSIDEARQLFAYGAWANDRVLAAAESLTEAQLVAAAASSFPSVAATLAHIVGAEWIWLRRWLGDNPAAPEWTRGASLAELRRQLAVVEAERSSYLASLTDGGLEQVVSYRNLAGQAYSNRLCDLMRHVVNHSTHHRGQAIAQLRQFGVTPPNTDLITYLRQGS
jgi:uncharacterized damage-inducible protein DinB